MRGGQEDTLYLILSSLHTHYKHELSSNQVGTQHTVNVVTHVPQRPVNANVSNEVKILNTNSHV